MSDLPILSFTIWLPIIGGVLVLASGDNKANVTRWTALTVALLVLADILSGFS